MTILVFQSHSKEIVDAIEQKLGQPEIGGEPAEPTLTRSQK